MQRASSWNKIEEYIPKECLSSLEEYLSETLGDTSDYVVETKGDPLIMWDFGKSKDGGDGKTIKKNKEIVLEYELNKLLKEDCQKALEGLGIGEIIFMSLFVL